MMGVAGGGSGPSLPNLVTHYRGDSNSSGLQRIEGLTGTNVIGSRGTVTNYTGYTEFSTRDTSGGKYALIEFDMTNNSYNGLTIIIVSANTGDQSDFVFGTGSTTQGSVSNGIGQTRVAPAEYAVGVVDLDFINRTYTSARTPNLSSSSFNLNFGSLQDEITNRQDYFRFGAPRSNGDQEILVKELRIYERLLTTDELNQVVSDIGDVNA